MPAVILWLGGLALFFLGTWCLYENKKFDFFVAFLWTVGIIFFATATFRLAPEDFPSGLPKTSIDAGTHKVGSMYIAGENVNITIEKSGADGKTERIYLHQFPKSAFEGTLNPNAKKLVVVQSGNFKKLRLE